MSALDLVRDSVLRAELESRIAEICQEAYAIQGKKSLESTRRGAALHEAGHAVAYAATADNERWWPPYRVSIWKEPVPGLTVWLGQMDVSPKAPLVHVLPSELEATLIHTIRLASGVVSELIFDGRDFRQASSLDEVMLVGGYARNLGKLHWKRPVNYCMGVLMGMTARILRAHSGAVTTMASVLEQRRKLQGQELAHHLRGIQRVTLPLGFDELTGWQP